MSETENLRKEIEELRRQLEVVGSILDKMNTISASQQRGKDTLALQAEMQQELGFLGRLQKKS